MRFVNLFPRSWLDRIPFTVLLGISTSVELFEGRLPRSCVALLRGKHFEVQEAGNCVDRIYESLQTNPTTQLWLGRNVTSTLFENTSDYFQTPEAFSRMVKVGIFSIHFSHTLLTGHSMHICLISSQILCQCFLASRMPRFSTKASFVRLFVTCHHSECKHTNRARRTHQLISSQVLRGSGGRRIHQAGPRHARR